MALFPKAGLARTPHYCTYTFIKRVMPSNLPDFVNFDIRSIISAVSHSGQHLGGGDMALFPKAGLARTPHYCTYTFIKRVMPSNTPDFVNFDIRSIISAVSHSGQHLGGGDMALFPKAGLARTPHYCTYTFIKQVMPSNIPDFVNFDIRSIISAVSHSGNI
jgi:hypothetical protein